MGKSKKHTNYESWSFLKPYRDYRPFKLVPQVGRVKSRMIELDRAEEGRFQEILEKNVVISFHEHSAVFPENPSEFLEYIRGGRFWIGYEGLARSGLDGFFEGLMNGIGPARSPDPWDWDNVVHQIGIYRADIDHQDLVFIATNAEDFRRAHGEGRIAMVLHLEAPPHIGEDLAKVDMLYGFGVRCMGITYSKGNEFGSGLADKVDRGLTDLGHALVERMNKLGILIDVSHVGDRTSLEVIEASEDPVVVTHAGARALWPTRRMKPDEVIIALADKGGVFGVEAAPHTTITRNNPRHSIESVMEHFQHVEKLVGIDHVAFGLDTIFGDHVSLHRVFSSLLSIFKPEEEPEHPVVDFVDGLENPSEFTNVIRWLIKHGYSDQDIRKVVGENILRVTRRVWGG
ncbi:MAG: membrane dipeptidase [Zestosphaera sp.]